MASEEFGPGASAGACDCCPQPRAQPCLPFASQQLGRAWEMEAASQMPPPCTERLCFFKGHFISTSFRLEPLLLVCECSYFYLFVFLFYSIYSVPNLPSSVKLELFLLSYTDMSRVLIRGSETTGESRHPTEEAEIMDRKYPQ